MTPIPLTSGGLVRTTVLLFGTPGPGSLDERCAVGRWRPAGPRGVVGLVLRAAPDYALFGTPVQQRLDALEDAGGAFSLSTAVSRPHERLRGRVRLRARNTGLA